MKKLVSLLLIALLAFSLTAAVGCKKADDVIKIGWIGSLTGDQAVWGTNESNTLKMLVDEINADGGIIGKQVQLICYDTKGDVQEAINATKRLVSQDKVCAIIGPNASGQAIGIQSILNEFKVPDIATVATNEKVTVAEDGTLQAYNFRVCFIDPQQGAIAAGFAAEVLGFTKAAILYDIASDYSQGLSAHFRSVFEAKGGTIVAEESFKEGDVEFTAQLTKIKEANPEIILMPYYYKEVALSANQARSLGINAVLIGGDGWPSEALFELAKEALQGSYIVNHLDFSDPDGASLRERYAAKYPGLGMELNGYMANDAMLLLKAAIEKAGSADSAAITKALTEVTVEGVTGTIQLSPEDHNPVGKEGSIVMIEGDGYVFVQKYGVGQ